MSPRTDSEMAENSRDFAVRLSANRLLGCGALYSYTPLSGSAPATLTADPVSEFVILPEISRQ